MPVLEAELQEKLQWKKTEATQNGGVTFPKGPMKWAEGEGSDRTALAVGSVGGKERREEIAILKSAVHTIPKPPKEVMPQHKMPEEPKGVSQPESPEQNDSAVGLTNGAMERQLSKEISTGTDAFRTPPESLHDEKI